MDFQFQLYWALHQLEGSSVAVEIGREGGREGERGREREREGERERGREREGGEGGM